VAVVRSIFTPEALRMRRAMSAEMLREVKPLVLKRDGRQCRYCGKRARGVDHLVALSLGGSDLPSNLVTCCGSCNSRLGNRPIFTVEGRRNWLKTHPLPPKPTAVVKRTVKRKPAVERKRKIPVLRMVVRTLVKQSNRSRGLPR
jgi:hypothetical protein